jgi:UDP-GlcNAc:undecaprenyl-phosphate GlcNAc-1-phosphate transferase
VIAIVLMASFGFVGGVFGSMIARAIARRFGIVNHPNPIVPQHKTSIAYLGGLGVLIGFVGAWIGQWTGIVSSTSPPLLLVVPAVLFCLVGLYDDLRPLHAVPKLAAQLSVAVLAVGLGLRADVMGVVAIDAGLSVFWIMACVNAFNFTDVCDGLVTGLGAVTFLVWAMITENVVTAHLAATGFGACLGFLPFNAPPASMFLGDAGSHLIGFLVAALALSVPVENVLLHPAQMVLLVFVPLFELVFITVIRLEKGLPWWKGSPDHFALRLQQAGWSRWQVDVASWATMGLAVTVGLVLARLPLLSIVGLFTMTMVFCIVSVRYLLRWEVERHG